MNADLLHVVGTQHSRENNVSLLSKLFDWSLQLSQPVPFP